MKTCTKSIFICIPWPMYEGFKNSGTKKICVMHNYMHNMQIICPKILHKKKTLNSNEAYPHGKQDNFINYFRPMI